MSQNKRNFYYKFLFIVVKLKPAKGSSLPGSKTNVSRENLVATSSAAFGGFQGAGISLFSSLAQSIEAKNGSFLISSSPLKYC